MELKTAFVPPLLLVRNYSPGLKSHHHSLASIVGVDSLDIEVSRFFKQLHQDGLDTLALVKHGLGSDFKASDVLEVDFVFRNQACEGCESNGIDIWRAIRD